MFDHDAQERPSPARNDEEKQRLLAVLYKIIGTDQPIHDLFELTDGGGRCSRRF